MQVLVGLSKREAETLIKFINIIDTSKKVTSVERMLLNIISYKLKETIK